jgi:hypothetical protein
MEISEDISGVDSLPDDFRYRLFSIDADSYALRMGDPLEDGLGHKGFEGT